MMSSGASTVLMIPPFDKSMNVYVLLLHLLAWVKLKYFQVLTRSSVLEVTTSSIEGHCLVFLTLISIKSLKSHSDNVIIYFSSLQSLCDKSQDNARHENVSFRACQNSENPCFRNLCQCQDNADHPTNHHAILNCHWPYCFSLIICDIMGNIGKTTCHEWWFPDWHLPSPNFFQSLKSPKWWNLARNMPVICFWVRTSLESPISNFLPRPHCPFFSFCRLHSKPWSRVDRNL